MSAWVADLILNACQKSWRQRVSLVPDMEGSKLVLFLGQGAELKQVPQAAAMGLQQFHEIMARCPRAWCKIPPHQRVNGAHRSQTFSN